MEVNQIQYRDELSIKLYIQWFQYFPFKNTLQTFRCSYKLIFENKTQPIEIYSNAETDFTARTVKITEISIKTLQSILILSRDTAGAGTGIRAVNLLYFFRH